MADLDPGRIVVVDSEGLRGTAAAAALHAEEGQVLIAFDQGRNVLAPLAMLHRRQDGVYSLPLSLRELAANVAQTDRNTDKSNTDNSAVIAVIPVIAEEARVAKRQVEAGRVRVQKTVETVEEQVDVPLLRDRVQVERIPVQRYLTRPAQVRQEGDTLVIPVMEEVIVVEKRLLLREEIHVTTLRQQLRHQETVPLQREEVTITRHDAGHDDAD